MTDPLIGKKIGQYEIQSLLGQGGMAIVYRAYQTALKRDVAMKVVSALLTQDPHFMERFNREVELIASLEHQHIIPVHEHGTSEDGVTYLTMRYLKGGTLSERIRQGSPMSLTEVNVILRQVADALDYAHQRGVIHRDIKPSNVLLDEQGSAFLADFGLARLLDPKRHKDLTAADTFLGTPTYISPEQVQQTTLDERSDLYSLGVIVYEMLAGRPPFAFESAFTIMRAHLDEAPPPIRKFRADTPQGIETILNKALSKKPQDRFQSAGEMAEAFNSVVQGEATTLRLKATNPFVGRSMLWGERPRLFAGGIIALLLLTAFGLFALRPAVAPTLAPTATSTIPPTIAPTDSPTLAPSAIAAIPTLDESKRPAKGTPDDLKLADSEILAARKSLDGSFIGMMACLLTTDYHASLARSVRARAQALNLPVHIEDANNKNFEQPAIINRMVAQGAKAIIVCELDSEAIAPALQAAQEAGVKIVRLSDIVSDKGTVTITLSNENMGRAVGLYTGDLINKEMNGQANVAVLDYPPVPAVVQRADAMVAALHEIAPDAKIVGHWQGGLTSDGEKSMTEALQLFPEINVIMSINDAGAYGAVNALIKAGKKPGDVAIISVDAEPEARRMINAGQFFRASVDSGAVASGEYAVDALVKLLAGVPVPRQIFLPGTVVTRDVATPSAAF
jgi:serine/threonine protein kinase/DNA-binding LacI/PurR family transcriptional regulator